ncbi:nitroreductase [Sphingobacterium oryzagri]|uniref:Nitroreductase n=1 Tax=Sphingobacterium oryzagri TaxID=3025669 RepID=A0ABY7WHX3_9SPHI|nr:nitroreductase [Sphingobacterium sp. KACC 22765]WDF69217.1 nitroreductase [Sphingobacterium sp. KACC 22765]
MQTLKQIKPNTDAFKKVIRLRKSCRGFLDTPVPDPIITSVLEDAQLAPSNCNTQPWETHIVSGDKLKELAEALLRENEAERLSPDFTFDTNEYHGRYKERYFNLGKTMYEAFDVKRDDKEGRKEVSDQNYKFFNAPHIAIPFMPSFGDNVRVGGDIGMYGQTFLLSLTAHGLAGIPQTALGFFAGTIREILNVPDELKMLFGISFGYADPNAPGNSFKMERNPISHNVTFHQ